MKIYFHFSPSNFANSYLICNEITKEAVVIDPYKINETIINQIERKSFNLVSVFITNNQLITKSTGLKTLLKIYSPTIYATETLLDDVNINILYGDGEIEIAGFKINYFSSIVPMFKVENVVFTGIAINAENIDKAYGLYTKKKLRNTVKEKILSMPDDTIIMPAYGPPSSVGAEKKFNVTYIQNDRT